MCRVGSKYKIRKCNLIINRQAPQYLEMAETRRPSPAASGKFVTVKALIMLIVPKSVLLSELTPKYDVNPKLK